MNNNSFFTSEFVSPGHPDKICDQISDAILDECLREDINSRVACETFATTGLILIGGEITTKSYVDVQDIARGAVDETPELMPLAITLAREIIKKLTELTRNKTLLWARPDAKSQVTLEYDGDKIVDIDAIVLSVQHDENVSQDKIKEDIKTLVFKPVLEKYNYSLEGVKHIYINPTGRFVIGGPHGDTGLTGRKIIVDTYGGYFRHGGGAFSGKDPSKVDRSAAYMARYIAKNIVASKIARKCEVQLSYAIGVAKPISIKVETFGTSSISEKKIELAISKLFDLSPRGIEKTLNLRKPNFKYKDLAAFGHIGRTDIDVPWEKTDMVDEILGGIE